MHAPITVKVPARSWLGPATRRGEEDEAGEECRSHAHGEAPVSGRADHRSGRTVGAMPKSAEAAWTMRSGPASLRAIMTRLSIATWNINSVRLRIAQVLAFLDERRPDVLCLQETKTADSTFPLDAFRDAGWPHAMIAGFKGRNGVAILSRHPFASSHVLSWCGKDDGRHVQVTFPDGLQLDNIYVPAGGAIPDPEINDKFAHKLGFLEEVTHWIAGEHNPGARRVLAGDLNIAPLEHDVWSHKKLLRAVSHTPVEVESLGRLYASHDWTDVARHFVPPSEKLYSWWPYRSGGDWSAKDYGRRLDHIWVTPALVSSLRSCQTLRHMRGHDQPSDHVPVVATLEFPG